MLAGPFGILNELPFMPCCVLLNTAFELTLQGFFPLSNVTGNFSLFSTLKQNKACHL